MADYNNLTEKYREKLGTALDKASTQLSNRKPYKSIGKINFMSIMSTIFTGIFGFLSGTLLLTLMGMVLVGTLGRDFGAIEAAIILSVTSIPFVIGFISMSSLRGRIKRFRKYSAFIGDRKLCPIKLLSKGVNMTVNDTIRDLEKMIDKGYFADAFLDDQKECIMMDKDTFQKYVYNSTMVDQMEQQRIQQQRQASIQQNQTTSPAKEKEEVVDPGSETTRMLDEGKKCLMEMKETVLWWRGGEARNRLESIEQTTLKIFDCVSDDPDKAQEIRKLMNYYLPTVVKLLRSYDRLDAQKVEGENISSAKWEIENILTTIESAFVKLLDQLFEDDAFDVSTDISVLETMLQQEGLTQSELSMSKIGGGTSYNMPDPFEKESTVARGSNDDPPSSSIKLEL